MAERSAVSSPYFCCVRNGFIAEIRSIPWSVANEELGLQNDAETNEKLQTDYMSCKYSTICCKKCNEMINFNYGMC